MNPFKRLAKWLGIEGKRAQEERNVAWDDLSLAIEEAIKEVAHMPANTYFQQRAKRAAYAKALRRIIKEYESQ